MDTLPQIYVTGVQVCVCTFTPAVHRLASIKIFILFILLYFRKFLNSAADRWLITLNKNNEKMYFQATNGDTQFEYMDFWIPILTSTFHIEKRTEIQFVASCWTQKNTLEFVSTLVFVWTMRKAPGSHKRSRKCSSLSFKNNCVAWPKITIVVDTVYD